MKWGLPMDTAFALNLAPYASNGWLMKRPSKSTGTFLPSRMGAPMSICTRETQSSSGSLDTLALRMPLPVMIFISPGPARPVSAACLATQRIPFPHISAMEESEFTTVMVMSDPSFPGWM